MHTSSEVTSQVFRRYTLCFALPYEQDGAVAVTYPPYSDGMEAVVQEELATLAAGLVEARGHDSNTSSCYYRSFY